jgi:tyrosine recombinase XerC
MIEVINQYIEAYLKAEKNLSPYTIRNYQKSVIDFNNYLARRKVTSLHFVDKQTIRGYLAQLAADKNKKNTISGKLSALRSFFKYLQIEKLIDVNPILSISAPKLDKRIPEFLTQDETEKLLYSPNMASPQGQRNRAILELLYAGGLRVSELVNLDVDQLDLDSREIRVVGKGSKERIILIGRPAVNFLAKYINDGRRQLLGGRINRALFVNKDGGRIPPRRVQKILDSMAKKAGFKKKVYPHLLRHTFATHMLDHDADLRVVQELLGHASLSTTQVYTHVSKAQSRRVYLASHPFAKEEK